MSGKTNPPVHHVRVGIMVVFDVKPETAHGPEDVMTRYAIAAQIKENVEYNMPEGMAMKIIIVEIDGKQIDVKELPDG